MSAVVTQRPPTTPADSPAKPQELTLYSHSPIYYWWPVWAVGYVLALLTLMQGQYVEFADATVLMHPNKTLGVVFTFTFFVVIVITHFSVRGGAALTTVMTAIALALVLYVTGWWEPLLDALGHLAIFMNLGFYVFFSTAVFVIWAAAVFFFDRFTYWSFRPGQMVHVQVLGEGEHAYDARGMSVEKKQDDLFRHWVLGLGSGDIHIMTTGAVKAEFYIKNVLFVGSKLERIQQLVAMKPDDTPDIVQTAGAPM